MSHVDGRENRETERRYGLANKRVAFPEPQQKLLEPPKRAYLAERDLEKRRHAESYHCVQS
jgi:hypothetical protein